MALWHTHRSFQEGTRVPPRARSELRVGNLQPGSIIVDLVAVAVGVTATAFAFPECRAALIRFVGRLRHVERQITGSAKSKPPPDFTILMEALSGIVAAGDARSINIYVLGDNRTHFTVSKDNAKRIHEGAARLESSARKAKTDASITADRVLRARQSAWPFGKKQPPPIKVSTAHVLNNRLIMDLDLKGFDVVVDVSLVLLTKLFWPDVSPYTRSAVPPYETPVTMAAKCEKQLAAALQNAWAQKRLSKAMPLRTVSALKISLNESDFGPENAPSK